MPEQQPKLLIRPALTVAVISSKGDPSSVGESIFPILYGAVYALKFQLKKAGVEDFKVTGLRARWPDSNLLPRSEWTAHWALPIPDGTTHLPKHDQSTDIHIERWEYGMVAELLHIGPYAAEGPTVDRLHRFIEESGFVIVGSHEEEYVTSPKAKTQKTLIRYIVSRVNTDPGTL